MIMAPSNTWPVKPYQLHVTGIINQSHSTTIAIVAIGLALKSGVILRNLTSWSRTIQNSFFFLSHTDIRKSPTLSYHKLQPLFTIIHIPHFSPKQNIVLSKTLRCKTASNVSGSTFENSLQLLPVIVNWIVRIQLTITSNYKGYFRISLVETLFIIISDC